MWICFIFFFSSRRRHTRYWRDWSSDVCSSDLGEWINGTGNHKDFSYNPSNGEKLTEFVDASNEDVDLAVNAAKEAFKSWKDVSIQERSSILLKIADLIDENKERLAMIETLDNGKPLRETLNIDLPLASDHFRYFAGIIRAEEEIGR